MSAHPSSAVTIGDGEITNADQTPPPANQAAPVNND